jgi:hypothetical protein
MFVNEEMKSRTRPWSREAQNENRARMTASTIYFLKLEAICTLPLLGRLRSLVDLW